MKRILLAIGVLLMLASPVAFYYQVHKDYVPVVNTNAPVVVTPAIGKTTKIVTKQNRIIVNCEKFKAVLAEHADQIKQIVSNSSFVTIKKQCKIKD